MTGIIGVGQKVVCVNAESSKLTCGQVYTIRRIEDFSTPEEGDFDAGILLEGISEDLGPGGEFLYSIDRFRAA